MITCTVHERDSNEADVRTRSEKIVFVREGVAMWALFFPLLWLLYHRLWLMLLAYLAAVFAIGALVSVIDLPEMFGGVTTLALSFLLMLEGNDLRRWTLARKGYSLVDVTGGRDMEECEQRFFETWLPGQKDRKGVLPTITPKRTGSGPIAGPRATPGDDVIGLFPEPGR